MQCVNSCIYFPCAVQPFLAPRFTDKMIHFFCFIPHAGDQMNFNILKLYISALILDSLEVLDNQKTRCSNIQMFKLDLSAHQKIFVFGKGSQCVYIVLFCFFFFSLKLDKKTDKNDANVYISKSLNPIVKNFIHFT